MKIRGQKVHSPSERISKMIAVDHCGCWNWTGSTRNGYGRMIVGSRIDGSRRSVSAHRYAFETMVGPIPDGMEICHKCDNRKCVNPSHLFAGSHQDNIDDREAKGRNNPPSGSMNGSAVLSEVEVLSARRLRSTGMSYQKIADRFGVHKMTVMRAIKGQHWAHVAAAPSAEGV